jgi:hypothetical protein
MDDLYFRGTTQPCVIPIFCLLRNDVHTAGRETMEFHLMLKRMQLVIPIVIGGRIDLCVYHTNCLTSVIKP